jgi:hypothetical protein
MSARDRSPHGVYVTSNGGAFYYRERPVGQPGFPSTRTIESADIGVLSDLSQDGFVTALNDATTRGNLQVVTALTVIAALVGAAALGATDRLVVELFSYGLIAFVLARWIELRRRRFLIVYDLDQPQQAIYRRLMDALAALAGSGRLRGVDRVGQLGDWKRNAGATQALAFSSAALRQAPPPNIVTNTVPWSLSVQRMTLYFLPDRLLIRRLGSYAAIAYSSLATATHRSPFVWDERVPADAQVVGQTWRYVRRDGGPDRRFNNNRQIPIVLTEYVTLTTTTGLDIALQTTRLGTGAQLAEQVAARGQQASSAPPVAAETTPALRAALSTFGIAGTPPSAELKRMYRELALRNHPDRFATASPDLQAFAAQRMKELNAAYRVLLQTLPATAEPPAQTESAPAPAPPALASTHDHRVAWAIAGAFAVAVFVLFRLAPDTIAAPSAPPPRTTAAPRAIAPAPVPSTTQPIRSRCPVRATPSTAGEQRAVIEAGAGVEVLEERRGWRRIRDPRGVEGWTGPRCWARPSADDSNAARRRAVPDRVEPPAEPAAADPVDPYADTAAAPPPDLFEQTATDPTPAPADRTLDPFAE